MSLTMRSIRRYNCLMLNVNHNAIKKFILPNALNLVMLDGVYRSDLSSQSHGLSLTEHALQVSVNFKLSLPLQLLFLYTKDCKCHFDINIGQNSSCVIIEEHIILNGFANSVSNDEAEQAEPVDATIEMAINITATNNSDITYYKIQNQNDLSSHHARTVVNQHKNSQVKYGFMGKGLSKSCDILQIHMLEEHSSFEALGAIILDKAQNLNYKMNIEHSAPNCSSNVLFKGVIDDYAVGDFACKVLVHPSAYKTETHVTNKNLLLSQSATMNTEPSMEIYTDDVNCTHGATVGQLDQEAIFYMRCRGIAHTQAVKLLTKAFTQEIVEKFTEYL